MKQQEELTKTAAVSAWGKIKKGIPQDLEDSLDYAPDWRFQIVQEYLTKKCAVEEGGHSSITEILARETDHYLKELLRVERSLPCDNDKAAIYAIRAIRVPNSLLRLKSMVIADFSTEEIGAVFGTNSVNVEYVEAFCFDARRYLKHREWLRNICYGPKGHRYLQVAFLRGRAGVKEVVLQEKEAIAPQRNLRHVMSVLQTRAEEFIFDREAQNITPDEKDLRMLAQIVPLAQDGAFNCLQDFPDPPETNSNLSKLPAGSREKIAAFLKHAFKSIAERHEVEGLAATAAVGPSTMEEKTT